MDRIVGGVEMQDELIRRPRKRGDELLDLYFMDR
jgi:hypothetical protein